MVETTDKVLCPWCGAKMDDGKDINDSTNNDKE